MTRRIEALQVLRPRPLRASFRASRRNSATRRPALLAAIALCGVNAASARPAPSGPNGIDVHTQFGGFVLGYDVDRAGDLGLLCEARTLANGMHDVAVETFDQTTGDVVQVVRRIQHTDNDFLALCVSGDGVGLVELEHSNGLFVDGRRYARLDPLALGMFTGAWTPPLGVDDIITSVSVDPGPVSVVLGFHNGGASETFLFSTNVGANGFGPKIVSTDPDFAFSNAPKVALDRAARQAVVAASNGCPQCHPKLARIDLGNGNTIETTGLGFGYVNGIAIDPATRIACTSTEIDFRIELYDLSTMAGTVVPIPGAVSQAQSGQDVQVDPVHHLFLVGQVFSSTAANGSSIQVFDEQGNHVESIDGLSLPSGPTRIALNPTTRRGFVLAAPDLTTLQGFDY